MHVYVCIYVCVCLYVSFKSRQDPVVTATAAATRTSTHLPGHRVQLMSLFQPPCSMIVVFESRRVVVVMVVVGGGDRVVCV